MIFLINFLAEKSWRSAKTLFGMAIEKIGEDLEGEKKSKVPPEIEVSKMDRSVLIPKRRTCPVLSSKREPDRTYIYYFFKKSRVQSSMNDLTDLLCSH